MHSPFELSARAPPCMNPLLHRLFPTCAAAKGFGDTTCAAAKGLGDTTCAAAKGLGESVKKKRFPLKLPEQLNVLKGARSDAHAAHLAQRQ